MVTKKIERKKCLSGSTNKTKKTAKKTTKTAKKGLNGCFSDHEILNAVKEYCRHPFMCGKQKGDSEYMQGFHEGWNRVRNGVLEIIEEMRKA